MRYLILLAALLLPLPSHAMSGVIGALVSSSSYPASVTSDFSTAAPNYQGWTASGANIGTTTDPTRSGPYAVYLNPGTLTKTVVSGAGELSFWTYRNDGTAICNYQIDGGTSTSCKPGFDLSFQKVSQSVTVGAHTITITGSGGLFLDDISYPHPGVPLWPSATAIGGVTAISQAGPTDTGTHSGMMSSGTISVTAACDAYAVGASAGVYLEVDGVVRSQVVCSDGGANSGTLTYTVTADTHSVRIYGTADDSNGTFSGTVGNVPVP